MIPRGCNTPHSRTVPSGNRYSVQAAPRLCTSACLHVRSSQDTSPTSSHDTTRVAATPIGITRRGALLSKLALPMVLTAGLPLAVGAAMAAEPSTITSTPAPTGTEATGSGTAGSSTGYRVVQATLQYTKPAEVCTVLPDQGPASCQVPVTVTAYIPDTWQATNSSKGGSSSSSSSQAVDDSTTGTEGPKPAVIFSPGFLVASSAYSSYLEALAKAGFPAVIYEQADSATDPVDDVCSSEILRSVMEWSQQTLQQQGPPAAAAAAAAHRSQREAAEGGDSLALQFVLGGHSRGGKISSLVAAADGRVVGLVLVDPADGSYDRMESTRFPSSLPGLSAPADQDRLLPTLIIGAGRNGDCIPKKSNFTAFSQAAPPPSATVTLSEAGHFVFLDSLTTLQQSVCNLGKAEPAAVRAACSAMVVWWARACAFTAAAGGTRKTKRESGGDDGVVMCAQDPMNLWASPCLVKSALVDACLKAGLQYEVEVKT